LDGFLAAHSAQHHEVIDHGIVWLFLLQRVRVLFDSRAAVAHHFDVMPEEL
jgi:hypothetical protein